MLSGESPTSIRTGASSFCSTLSFDICTLSHGLFFSTRRACHWTPCLSAPRTPRTLSLSPRCLSPSSQSSSSPIDVLTYNSMNEVMPFIWPNFPVHDNLAVESIFFSMNCLYCSRDVLRPIFCGWRQSWRQSWSAPSRGCRSPLSPSLESCLLCPGLLLPGWRCLSHPNNLKVMQLLVLILMQVLTLMILLILMIMFMLFPQVTPLPRAVPPPHLLHQLEILVRLFIQTSRHSFFLKSFA